MSDTSTAALSRAVSQIPGGEWFTGAGFGVFIHWDHASQQGLEISWPLVGGAGIPTTSVPEQHVSVEKYQSSAATFDPTEWDAPALARLLREAGATYAVFTARHHAGYAMFRSAHSDFSVASTPSGRDLTREYVDAMRAEGIRVGLYYSLSDWNHPDYPAFTDADRPYPGEHWSVRDGVEVNTRPGTKEHRRADHAAWQRYRDYLRGQLTELLTDYGQIDLLWFDGQWERTIAEWQSEDLRALIKSLQPNVVINDRLLGQGDYATPEQAYPLVPPDGPWELCQTIGDYWAWRPDDVRNKSARRLIAELCDVAGRGGNLLLNIGPRGDGSLNPDQTTLLEQIGAWMSQHAESVIGVAPTQAVDFHGPTTTRPGRLYLHLVMQPVGEFAVRGIPIGRVQRVYRLADGLELEHDYHLGPDADPDRDLGELRIAAPDSPSGVLDVIAIDLR
ncbi:alpha-L-fucosidase [Ruania alba]|uniref:alpha-L-fucosidase n=1 Tax=Ruania alba TaxID=648782 RepID=A0A1H5M5T3_9MICO|nr:alpha-L-fucosidase [Ruania alba]SEE84595.1 alpha-L-fucosidase [Ruania alba]